MTDQDGFKQIYTHAIAVGGHADDTRAQCAKHLNGPQVGGHLNYHLVARAQQQATGEPYTLRRAGEDQDVLRINSGASLTHARGNTTAQAEEALDRAIP